MSFRDVIQAFDAAATLLTEAPQVLNGSFFLSQAESELWKKASVCRAALTQLLLKQGVAVEHEGGITCHTEDQTAIWVLSTFRLLEVSGKVLDEKGAMKFGLIICSCVHELQKTSNITYLSHEGGTLVFTYVAPPVVAATT